MTILSSVFFDQDAQTLAIALLGKVLRVNHKKQWLSARIIETEAYYLSEKASHASLGYTEKRKALFMSPGTIYMYYARGRDSLNVSAQGPGNAVLIKSGYPYYEDLGEEDAQTMISLMQRLNPPKNGGGVRAVDRLCSGQTLLCQSLGLTVREWDQQVFNPSRFYIDDVAEAPEKIVKTQRLGIPKGRDEHLPYRFIDARFLNCCTNGRRKMALLGPPVKPEDDEVKPEDDERSSRRIPDE